MSHIVVVGSGIAGLIVAIRASRQHEVTLVTKSELGESNTRYAQGGIAAALFPDDSVQEHMADTLAVGCELNRRDLVRILCSEGPDRVRDLIDFGVAFDRADGQLVRGLEAAHSHARIVHAGGDATGSAIESALLRAVRSGTSEILEFSCLSDILLADGVVTGISVLNREGIHREISADAVVLATGGAGQLYAHTTNPQGATGDGVAAAYRAGASLGDLEFYQFHPTSLDAPGHFLISEAVRGEGAVLRDYRGNRFMQSVHPEAELAPRDVVAREIARQMLRQPGIPIVLDATALGSDFLSRRFPGITAECLEHGFDWSAEPIPVTPAAHYWMGGINTDQWGRTTVPGLYAVGEAACTGVHGANRLASNSLLESVVFSWRCVTAIEDAYPWPDGLFEDSANDVTTVIASSPAVKPATPFTRTELQHLLWNNVGLARNATTLHSAREQCATWLAEPQSVEELENANLLLLGQLIATAAATRNESRGAHFRTDYPQVAANMAHHLNWTRSEATFSWANGS